MEFQEFLLMAVVLIKPNLVLSTDIESSGNRFSSITATTTDDHVFPGQALDKRKVANILDCSFCLVGDQFKSFNFNKATGDCYLNGKRARDKELIPAKGYIYGEKDLCYIKPCQNGGECSMKEDRQDYKCKCKPRFTGRNCEVKYCSGLIPVGLENRKIPDSSMTASSQWDKNRYPGNGRINSNYCWGPKQSRLGEWLQVDLGRIFPITAIATQGEGVGSCQHVKTYKLQFDTETLNSGSPFVESGKTFTGNCDIVRQTFSSSFDARYIRVLPQTWHGWITLRIELYAGC